MPTSSQPDNLIVGKIQEADREERGMQITVAKQIGSKRIDVVDSVSLEEPLEIKLNYCHRDQRHTRSIAVIMRTPGKDHALAAGFLFAEGIIDDPAWIADMVDELRDDGNPNGRTSVLVVILTQDARPRIPAEGRSFYVNSGCGVCGRASLVSLHATRPAMKRNQFKVTADLLYLLPEKLRAAQLEFSKTGGLHAIGLFDNAGMLIKCSEDVGRHNAMDKVIGAMFLSDELPLSDAILMLSGRASFELLQKSVRAGISMVIAIGAPSSMAIRIAQEFDVTLVGFLNRDRFNVYHGKERVAST
jgi:FdhD protein